MTTPGSRDRLATIVLFAAIAALFAAVYLRMPCRTFYSPDEGVKFLQMQGMEKNPLRPCRLVYPGRGKDPSLFYYPSRAEFTVYYARIFPFADSNGYVRTNWLPWFPFVTKLFFAWIGMRGLYLIPFLAGLVALWLTGRIAATLEPGARRLTLLAFGLSSPLLFYSITFWEHTPSLVFLFLALFCVLPIVSPVDGKRAALLPRLAAAAALLLCSVAIRRESLFFALALGSALAIQAGPARLGVLSQRRVWIPLAALAGTAVALLALSPWILPQRTAADLYVTLYRLTRPETWLFLDTHFFNVFLLLKEDGPLPTFLRWCGQGGLLLCIVNYFWPRTQRLEVFFAGALLLLAPAVSLAFTPERYRALHSLFLSAPFVVFALLPVPGGHPQSGAERLIRTTALLYAFLYYLGTWPTHRTHGGLEWGSRYAFVLFALLLVIASVHWLRWRQSAAARGWKRIAVQGLVLLTLLLGSVSVTRGVRELNLTRRDLALIQDALAAQTSPIVTDCWWLGAGMAGLFSSHEVYTLVSPDELHDWLNSAGTNETSFTYASYVPLPEKALLREKNRITPDACEVVRGMTISNYRVRPAAR